MSDAENQERNNDEGAVREPVDSIVHQEEQKKPEGRPTKYDDSIVEKAREYLEACEDEEYERVKTEGDKSTSYELSVKVKIPTIEGLSLYLKVRRSTVYEWIEKYEEFSDIVDEIMAVQAQRLLENGLSGIYNSKIAQIMLSKHGYIERKEEDVHTDGKLEIKIVKYDDSTDSPQV